MIKKNTFRIFLLLFVLSGTLSAGAQPFINEINYFKKLDSLNAPPAHPILFIGSSSFTRWKDVQEYFPSHIILNRGFGGSSLPHLIRYAEDVIFKYHPKQIVIYCGENDLTGGDQITGQTVFERFRELYSLIRSRLPKVPIVYVSMKPSPSREKYLPAMEEGNRLIKKFCKKKRRTEFVDVFHPMLTPEGKFKPDIYTSDNLHMNEKGYAIWQPIIEPYLKD